MACQMRAVAVFLFLVAAPVMGAELDKHRPVSKVITILKDMVGQLEKEAVEDKEVFEAFGCWCETGLKGKTIAIADAEQKIGSLTSTIEDLASNSARLTNEISNLNKEVAKNTEALESATEMREKELSEFTANERSSVDTINTMKTAIGALSKHNAASLLQMPASEREEHTMEMAAALASQFRRHHAAVPAAQRKLVDAFLASPVQFLTAAPARISFLQAQGTASHNPEYAPQSGAIFGVLGAMKENFETNLAASQKEEKINQSDHEGLKAGKTAELAAGTNLADTKSQELGESNKRHAEAEVDLKETERTLAADQDFLANLKEKCAVIDEEYEERTKTRQLEITAVSKALAYLSSDEAADLFSRTLNPTFLQIPIGQQVAGSDQAAAEEGEGEAAGGDPGLEQAAAAEKQESAFEQVEMSVQDMVNKLVDEKEDEIKLKDFCIDSLQKNEADTDEKNREKADHEAKIDALAQYISQLAKEIAEHTQSIADNRVSLKRNTEDREKANKDFQSTVADQRATRLLLTGALKILQGFYGKAVLTQTRQTATAASHQPAGPPPPPDFKEYSKGAASGGVMGMIEQIIKDAQAMEDEALKGELDAQEAYESFVAETNAAVVAAQKAIVKKEEIKATTEEEKVQTEVELKTVNTEIAELKQANLDLHKQCDYTLANFDDRQASRDAEIHSLKESIAILHGQKMAAAKNR